MKSYDYRAMVYTDDHRNGDVFCVGCLPDPVEDAEEKGAHPIFADSEWSYVPVCVGCGEHHDYIILIEQDDDVDRGGDDGG